MTSSTFDVTQFGAKPGLSYDSTSAFEAAFASAALAVKANLRRKSVVVKVPAAPDPYLVNRTLYVPPWVCLAGDGRDASRILSYENLALPVLCFGVPEPDMTGVRPGFSTKRGHVLQLDGWSALGSFRDSGDWGYWEDVSKLTIDVAFSETPTGLGLPVLGLGQYETGTARPWFLMTNPDTPGWYRVYAATNRVADEAARSDVCFDVCAPVGAKHIAVSFDLTSGVFAGWADGVQVPVELRYSPAPASDLRLRHNTDWPFLVGSSGMGAASPVTPMVLEGLRVSENVRYQVGKPGDLQTTTDGSVLTGLAPYVGGADTIFYLPFTEKATCRSLAVVGSNGWAGAAQIYKPPLAAAGRQWARGLSLEGRGPSVLLGAVDSFSATDCSFRSDFGAAVGSVAGMTSYPTVFTRCLFGTPEGGAICGVNLFAHSVAFRDCRWEGYGRHALRIRGTSCRVDGSFFGECRRTTRSAIEFAPWSGYQTPMWSVSDMVFDCESGPPSEAAIIAWQTAAEGAHLEVDRMVTARIGVPGVRLRGWTGATVPGTYRIGKTVTPGSASPLQADEGWQLL